MHKTIIMFTKASLERWILYAVWEVLNMYFVQFDKQYRKLFNKKCGKMISIFKFCYALSFW